MFLQNNDVVALVSPAGYLSDKKVINQAQKILKKWGLKSIVMPNASTQNGHFAGTDKQRLSDLQNAMDMPEVKMIWALRGGYGSIRIVNQLDFSKFKQYPKLLTGFSDITILHLKWQQMGYESLHGLMPVQFKDKIPENVIKQFKNAIFGKTVSYSFDNNKLTSDFTEVSGILTGGNLANLYSVLGTNLDFTTNEKILFIEEVGEKLYAIDRMIIAMKNAGKFDNLKALMIGQFTDIPQNDPEFGKTVNEIILEHTAEFNFPVIFDVPVGHISGNYPLLLGIPVEIIRQENKIFLRQNPKK
jgi:muramoyltetrapeptide carboxypeptidase